MPTHATALNGWARPLPLTIRVVWAFVVAGVLGSSARGAWPADAPNPPPAIDPRLIVSLPSSLDQAMVGTPNGLHVLAEAAYSFGTTVTGSGDVYFTEFGNQRIQRFSVADGSLTTIVTDRPGLYGITTDRQGNIFYAQDSDVGTGRIVKRTPSGSEEVICSGLTRPRQLSTDADGNVYAVLETRSILKWNSATGNVQTVVNSLQMQTSSPPQGVAVGSDGRIYFSTYSETGSYGVALQPGGVWVRETNGSITQVAGGLWRARGLAFHPNGKLYAVTEANAWDQGNSGLLVEIDPTKKTTKNLLAGIDYAQFPAVGPDGRIYVTAARDEKLVAYDPAQQFTSQAIAEPDLQLSVENATWRETIAQAAFPLGLKIDTVAVDGYLTFGQGASDASMWLKESPAPDFSEDPEAFLVYVDVKAPGSLSANRWKGGSGWSSAVNWSTGAAPTAISGESWVEPLSVWSATSFPVVSTAGNKVQNLILGDNGEGASLRVAGGTLDATGSIRLGDHYDATVNVVSGSLTAAGDLSLSTSNGHGDGSLNVSGGTVKVGGQLLLGWNANAGTLTISSGSVEAGGVLIFNLDGGNAGAKESRVNLYGGTLAVGGLSINTLDPARLDIAGGRFILPASNLGNVNYWINSGNITALDGRRAVDVTPAAGNLLVCTARRLATDVVIDVASGSQTQAQAGYPSIAAATWLTKSGTGEVVFNSANSYPGMTSVTAGRLRIAHASALAGSEAVMITGGEVTMPSDRPLDVSIRKLSIDEALGSKLDIGAGRVHVAAGGITATDLMAALLVGRDGARGMVSGASSRRQCPPPSLRVVHERSVGSPTMTDRSRSRRRLRGTPTSTPSWMCSMPPTYSPEDGSIRACRPAGRWGIRPMTASWTSSTRPIFSGPGSSTPAPMTLQSRGPSVRSPWFRNRARGRSSLPRLVSWPLEAAVQAVCPSTTRDHGSRSKSCVCGPGLISHLKPEVLGVR